MSEVETMSADRPQDAAGRQYHIALRAGDVPSSVLMPGDPARVDKILASWDEGEIVGQEREFRAARGKVHGVALGALSHGVGSGSTAIAVEELCEIGVQTMIRVGSTGAIQPGIDCGDLVISLAAVRLDGVSDQYVQPAYPAVADHAVVGALMAACEQLGLRYHVGITASTASFHLGQGRAGFGGYRTHAIGHLVEDLKAARVLNFDMESATLFTLASLFGRAAGTVSVVYANRTTGQFRREGMERAIAAANLAAAKLQTV